MKQDSKAVNPAVTSVPFRYILRYLIDPNFEAQTRTRELISFCEESGIEEVMLFVAAEELSTGHPTEKELRDYIGLGKQLKRELDRKNIALSLNPWSTVYHNFRGRRLHEGQNFRRMVGETGVQNPVAVCPLCPEWRRYIVRSFVLLTREIQPVALWIEDDWRMMNHDNTLGWGGCFCEEHLRLFSARAGQTVKRQELLSAILQPGPPHAWRKLWLDLAGETLLHPLQRLSAAIRQSRPGTRVALMSSSPDAHSTEGRSWKAFQEAVGTEPAFMTRPNMGPYTQVPALQAPPSRPRMTIANLSGPLEIYPELENSPRCGPYSKSAKYSGWQMINCAMIGSHGVTINHYDMLGNGIALDPAFGRELRRLKPFLNRIAEKKIDDRQAEGVGILFSPNIAKHLHAPSSESIWDLMQESYLWGDICATLGIAHRYTSSVDDSGTPIFVSGQTMRAYSDQDLERLFRGPVILDADSVHVALERGFRHLIGIEDAQWASLQNTAYSYEEIFEEDISVYGLKRPRMSAQRCALNLLNMQAQPSAKTLSRICKCDHTPLWPGCLLFRNALGGIVASITYPVRREAQFFMGFFNTFRRTFLQRLLWQMAPSATMAMVEEHPMHCYRHALPGLIQLAITNPTDDSVRKIILDLPSEEATAANWQTLTSSGEWSVIVPSLQRLPSHDRYHFPVSLAYLEGTMLRWNKHQHTAQ